MKNKKAYAANCRGDLQKMFYKAEHFPSTFISAIQKERSFICHLNEVKDDSHFETWFLTQWTEKTHVKNCQTDKYKKKS